MVGRQAAKIRCRKCEYLIQIAYRPNSDEFDVTATPPSGAPPPPPSVPPPPRAPKPAAAGQPVTSGARARGLGGADEGIASKKPTAAVPGLPGLSSLSGAGSMGRNGAGLLSDASGRRPLAPLPPPPVPPLGFGGASAPTNGAGGALGGGLDLGSAGSPPPGGSGGQPAPPRGPASTQLADQFRESVQAGGAVEDVPQEGWFVGVNGVPLGPIPLGDLRELAMAGHIDRRSLVWRDGQAEWRPLGKFPGLARLLDDGAPLPAPREPSPAPAPPPVANGANGHTGVSHIATGFDAPRPDVTERPSVWGDLDDEDDEDEQPTTVKGRVSVMPMGDAPLSVTGLPLPSSPSAAPGGATNSFGITSSVPTVSAPPVGPPPQQPASGPPAGVHSPGASFAPTEPAAPISIISATPESMDDPADGLRPRGRSKWYLIAAAIVVAFALGAIVTHLMRSSSSEKTTSDGSGAAAGALTKRPYDDLGSSGAEAASGRRQESITAALRPGDVEDRAEAAAVALDADRWDADGSTGKGSASGALSRRGNTRPASRARVSGSGLDATAIQRTVRRYSPGVRQNCWLRALDARPPGVPTSAKLTATITVEANGQVRGVAVNGAPRGYPSLSRCVAKSVKSWQFPRSGAQTVTNVPFMFMGGR